MLPMRDKRQQQLKIELLSQWKLEAESRKNSVLIRFSDFSVWGNCIKRANDMKQSNLIIATVLREPTTISLQQMQFYIGKIKHI